MRSGHPVRKAMSGLGLATVFAFAAWAVPITRDKAPAISILRWEEGQPGCTFSRDDDGKYRYGYWTADFGIVVAMDSGIGENTSSRPADIHLS
jgi:hypothetical protein